MMDSQKQKKKEEELGKKLQHVKSVRELKKLMNIAEEQNGKLSKQIKDLRERVQILKTKKESKEQQKQLQSQNSKVQEVNKLRQQLKQKYIKMQKLKTEISLKKGQKNEQSERNKERTQNIISQTTKQIQNLTDQLKVLKRTNVQLNKTAHQSIVQSNPNRHRVEQLQQQNKRLRSTIANVRKSEYKLQNQAIQVQNSLYDKKIKHKNYQIQKRMSMKNLKANILPVKSKEDMIAQMKILQKQVDNLKQQVQTVKQNQKSSQVQQKQKRNQLLSQNANAMQKLKQIEFQKVKIQRQNNLWKKKWADICRSIQKSQNKIQQINIQSQTSEFIDQSPLRKDYAGILSRFQFDDRYLLKQQKKTMITGMMIYEADKGIAGIQALYSNGMKTEMAIPLNFISRAITMKIQCSEGDFFKLFKIKFNTLLGRISKVEIRSNKNVKYQFGDKKPWADVTEEETIYGFDIGVREYPVSIFGSYVYNKGTCFLEGLGVQINQLQETVKE